MPRLRQVKKQVSLLTAVELFQQVVRKQWNKIPGTGYQAKTLTVELNLAKKPADPAKWVTVSLQFVRGIEEDSKPQAGKHDWALFLCTDPQLSPQTILEVSALRWGIEVYLKESKQHLGLLKEQTITFASHLASISLIAIRYLMQVYVTLKQDKRPSQVRTDLSTGLMELSFGQALGAVSVSDR